MIDLAVAVAAGYLAGRLGWFALRPVLFAPALVRANYRGQPIPSGAGILIPLALIGVEAGRAVAGGFGVGDSGGPTPARALVMMLAIGFGLLGLVDDLLGDSDHRGFRGHLMALTQGRITTGVVKLVGGAAVALVVVSPIAGRSPGRLMADAALVALAANLGNLLDRRPGRTIKASAGAFVALALAVEWSPHLSGVAVIIGCSLALALDDLHEKLMLGDAGANALGAVLGFGMVVGCAPSTRNAWAVVLLGLNLAGEALSFTRVIDAVPPLRAVDRAGRLPRAPGSHLQG